MGYRKIDNLYKSQVLLVFKEVYALEKIHGTSAHLAYRRSEDGTDALTFFSGGAKHEAFVALFDRDALLAKFREKRIDEVTVYGEAYGGSVQRMRDTYGEALRFVAFEVKSKTSWWPVEHAHFFVRDLGLEFVHYERGPATIEWLDAQRDATSEQARRNGIEGFRQREGIVVRPPVEFSLADGGALRAKHKRPDFCETGSKRETRITDPSQIEVLERAEAIADEWVTEMRLAHVLDKLPAGLGIESTRTVIDAMVADVLAEAKGEIVEGRDTVKAISGRAGKLFRAWLGQARPRAADIPDDIEPHGYTGRAGQ